MTQPSLDSFFSGGGGKSVSWKGVPIGTTVTGTIKSVGEPQQATDPATQLPAVTRQGKPRIQVRISLQTTERDPSDPEDDGTRNLYVGGWMTGAIGDAMRKSGTTATTPEIGAVLTVRLSEREDNGPAVNPTNKFVAAYVPPAAQATAQFFEQPSGGVAGVVPPQDPPAAVVPPQAQQLTPEQVAAIMAAQAPAAPAAPTVQRPAQITEASWSQMNPETQANVAKTLASIAAPGLQSPGEPPF